MILTFHSKKKISVTACSNEYEEKHTILLFLLSNQKFSQKYPLIFENYITNIDIFIYLKILQIVADCVFIVSVWVQAVIAIFITVGSN